MSSTGLERRNRVKFTKSERGTTVISNVELPLLVYKYLLRNEATRRCKKMKLCRYVLDVYPAVTCISRTINTDKFLKNKDLY